MTTVAIHRQEDWHKPALLVVVDVPPARCEVYEIHLDLSPQWERTQNQEAE